MRCSILEFIGKRGVFSKGRIDGNSLEEQKAYIHLDVLNVTYL